MNGCLFVCLFVIVKCAKAYDNVGLIKSTYLLRPLVHKKGCPRFTAVGSCGSGHHCYDTIRHITRDVCKKHGVCRSSKLEDAAICSLDKCITEFNAEWESSKAPSGRLCIDGFQAGPMADFPVTYRDQTVLPGAVERLTLRQKLSLPKSNLRVQSGASPDISGLSFENLRLPQRLRVRDCKNS